MGGVFEKFQREHDEKVRKEIEEKTVEQFISALNLLKKGLGVTEVVEKVALERKYVEGIQELLNK